MRLRFATLTETLWAAGREPHPESGWAVWHLPNFFIPEMGTWQGSLLLYTGVAVALSIMHTWVYNCTQGSLLLVTLLHAAVDASTRTLLPLIFGTDRATGNLVPVIGFGLWALLVVVLTRTRLGYQPETHTDA